MEENIQKEISDQPQEQKEEKSPKADDNKLFAILSYLGILCLIPLLTKKNNPFIFFHAKQGLILFLTAIISSFLAIIPFLGPILSVIAFFGILVLIIIGILNVLGNKTEKLPLIGKFADLIKI